MIEPNLSEVIPKLSQFIANGQCKINKNPNGLDLIIEGTVMEVILSFKFSLQKACSNLVSKYNKFFQIMYKFYPLVF